MVVDQTINSINEIIHMEYIRGILNAIYSEGMTEGSIESRKQIVDAGLAAIIEEMEHNTGLKYRKNE